MPDFSRLNGIKNCLKEERPERIYEVIATGKEIFKISFFHSDEQFLENIIFLFSI